ncbi:MAG: segregation/condensation protein A [bacterium]|nr:segregation/condensation protein A [bacterium]
MEAMSLEELGAGRDMSAAHSVDWESAEEFAPAEAAAPAPNPPSPGAATAEADDPFLIKLDMFEGPLELLLHLVREHELDIQDIPIAFITDQYIKYIEMMRQLNLNVASEYLVMAAHLVYIKSRALVPQEGDAEEEEPDAETLRVELQRQLLEYQKFKDLSQDFRLAEETQFDIFTRGGNGDGIILEPLSPEEEAPRIKITVFDLISAIQRVIEESGEAGMHLVEVDELEIVDRQAFLLDMLENSGPEGIEFHAIFPKGARVLELVVTFLALLELVKQSLIVAYQNALFGEIRLVKAVLDD